MGKRSSHKLAEKREEVRIRAQEAAQEQVTVRGHQMEQGHIFKLVGLGAFVAVMAAAVWMCWPLISTLMGEGGFDEVKRDVQQAGPSGMLVLLAFQFLQVVVAFIPGEAVQIVAGLLYGPWVGAAIILLGCVVSSAVIFTLVHKLGAPFVRSMVPEKYMNKIRNFEEGPKLRVAVFTLFLIPGLPKDVFTYIVPLTNLDLKEFLALSNIARIPGIVVSTYAAHGFVEGKVWQSVFLFVVMAIVAVAGLMLSERIMEYFQERREAEGDQ